MWPRSLRSLLLTCLLLASSSPSIDAAKRRSRLDLPISKPADAPLEDNLATASGSEPAYERVEAPAAITPAAAATSAGTSAETESSANASGSGSSENSSQMIDEYSDEECDPDFIAFELVTG